MGVRLAGKTALIGKTDNTEESSSPRAGPVANSRPVSLVAGRSFARLTVVPPLLVIAWLVPGIPLLLAGRFLPIPMVLIAAPLAAILMVATFRETPGRWPGPARAAGDAQQSPARAWTAWS